MIHIQSLLNFLSLDAVLHAVADDNHLVILQQLDCLAVRIDILEACRRLYMLYDACTHSASDRSPCATAITDAEVSTEGIHITSSRRPVQCVLSSDKEARRLMIILGFRSSRNRIEDTSMEP